MEEIDLSQELIDFAIKIHDRQMMHLESNGRIEKTIIILDYISNEELRRRIQKGLIKVKLLTHWKELYFFAKRGEFHERDLQDQMQRASVLNILMNAITV